MPDKLFNILLISGGICGSLLSIPYFIGRIEVSKILLGTYLILLTLSFVEPLKKSMPAGASGIVEVLIGTASFMLGPTLFLYCRYKTQSIKKWNIRDSLHFFPSIIIFGIMVISLLSETPKHMGTFDFFLYGFFVIYLMAYSVESLMFIIRVRRKTSLKKYQQEMTISFLYFLVLASLILFAFSTLFTLLGNAVSKTFVTTIQIFIFCIIMGIALLNPELSPVEEDIKSRK
jgi:hypothetical protein